MGKLVGSYNSRNDRDDEMNEDCKTAIISMFKNLNEDMVMYKRNERKILMDPMVSMELKNTNIWNEKLRLWKKHLEGKRQAINWEKIFVKCISDKGLVLRIYKVRKPNSKKIYNPAKIWAGDLNQHLTKENKQLTDTRMKRWSTSSVIGEI